eukprot:COSAG06_NODE_822_length_12092_cov_48.322105_11_plen_612_part_00
MESAAREDWEHDTQGMPRNRGRMTRDQFETCLCELGQLWGDHLPGAEQYNAKLAEHHRDDKSGKKARKRKEQDHEAIVLPFLHVLAQNIAEDDVHDRRKRKLKDRLLSVRFIERCDFPTWNWKHNGEEETADAEGDIAEHAGEEEEEEEEEVEEEEGLAAWSRDSTQEAEEEKKQMEARHQREIKRRKKQRQKKKQKRRLQRQQKQKESSKARPGTLVCYICRRATVGADADAEQTVEPDTGAGDQQSQQQRVTASRRSINSGGTGSHGNSNTTLVRGCNCQGSGGMVHIECLQKLATQANEKVWRRCVQCGEHWANSNVRLQLARAWVDHTAELSWKEPERIRATNHLTLALRLSARGGGGSGSNHRPRPELLEEAASVGRKNLELLMHGSGRSAGGGRTAGQAADCNEAVISAMARLAQVYIDQGNTADALPLQLQALAANAELQCKRPMVEKSFPQARLQLMNDGGDGDVSGGAGARGGTLAPTLSLAPIQKRSRHGTATGSASGSKSLSSSSTSTSFAGASGTAAAARAARTSLRAVVSDPSGIGLRGFPSSSLASIESKRRGRPRGLPKEGALATQQGQGQAERLGLGVVCGGRATMSLSLPKLKH